MQLAQVQPLVRERRPIMPQGEAKKKKNNSSYYISRASLLTSCLPIHPAQILS